MSGSAAAAAAAAAAEAIRSSEAMRCVSEIRGHHTFASELRCGFDLERRVGWCSMAGLGNFGMCDGLSRRKQRGEADPLRRERGCQKNTFKRENGC